MPLLLLALALLAAPARACQCDMKRVQALAADPASAKTALVMRLEERPGHKDGVLRTEFAWTAWTGGLEHHVDSTCSLHLTPGRRVLILSTLDMEAVGKRGRSFTACDSMTVPLSEPEAGAVVAALGRGASAPYAAPNPSWLYCRADKDCVEASAACGGRTAVNRRHARDQAAWVRRVAPTLNCSGPESPPKDAAPACVESFCSIGR